MAGLGMCGYKDCPGKNNCRRFTEEIEKTSAAFNFKAICNESNNYKWVAPIEKSLVIVKK